MTNWTDRWDKKEGDNTRRDGQPLFPIKVMILTGIILFCFMLGFGVIVMSTDPTNIDCGDYEKEYDLPLQCGEYFPDTGITVR